MRIPPERVDRFRRDLAPLWPYLQDSDSRLGLAVSGGGDSLALLLLAQALLPGRVEAATVDHGLRPGSAEEAGAAAALCAEVDVPHVTLAVSVASGNVQDRARTARYDALGAWCEARALCGLATAHHLDDQAETVLMRLNRGSGVAGLAAIRRLSTVPGAGVRLLRPLLGWRRRDLAEIVEQAGWQAAADPSNDDPSFDRVRIRAALREASWLDCEGIARSARLLAEADEAIIWAVGREFREHVSIQDGSANYYALRSGCGSLIRGEVVGAIFRRFGASITRSEAAELVERLANGEKVNLAGMQASVGSQAGDRVWRFAPENPRRTS